jgi:uncharacterized protein YjiS (DUF1127 family)
MKVIRHLVLNLKERDLLRDVGLSRRMILKRIQGNNVSLAQEIVHWLCPVRKVMELTVT